MPLISYFLRSKLAQNFDSGRKNLVEYVQVFHEVDGLWVWAFFFKFPILEWISRFFFAFYENSIDEKPTLSYKSKRKKYDFRL